MRGTSSLTGPTVPHTAAYSRLALAGRPGSALDRAGDREARFDHSVEPDLTRVALGDRVGRDQPNSPTRRRAVPAHAGRSTPPGRHSPSRPAGKDVDQPVPDVRSQRTGQLLATEERRVSDDRVETATFDDDIGRLDDPVQWPPALVVGRDGGREPRVDDRCPDATSQVGPVRDTRL